MKFKNLRFSIFIFVVMVALISCEDDEQPTIPFVERNRAEQQLADKDSLLNYLTSHYYNSSFFETGSDHKYTDIVITELAEGETTPSGNTLLIDAVETYVIEYLEVYYEYYILRLNQGGGKSPRFTDAVRVRYEGSSVVNGEIFDSRVTPINLPLVGNGFNTFGTIKAWQLVLSQFNTAVNFDIDGNGNVNFSNFGLGIMYVPSGLAYFSGSTTGASYDNLIFKFELLQYEEQDHDQDGIPSYAEDLNGNLDVNDEDTNDDGFPNYINQDDDGDGVFTFNELQRNTRTINEGEEEPTLNENEYELRREVNGAVVSITTVTALDTNGNGVLDYLDDTVSINYNEEEN